MSKVTASTDIDQVKPEEAQRFIDIALQDIVQRINGDLDFQTNFNCAIVSVNFTAQNTDQAVSHGLGRIPTGYIPINQNVATRIFNGTTASTSGIIYLQSTQVATVGLIIF